MTIFQKKFPKFPSYIRKAKIHENKTLKIIPLPNKLFNDNLPNPSGRFLVAAAGKPEKIKHFQNKSVSFYVFMFAVAKHIAQETFKKSNYICKTPFSTLTIVISRLIEKLKIWQEHEKLHYIGLKNSKTDILTLN